MIKKTLKYFLYAIIALSPLSGIYSFFYQIYIINSVPDDLEYKEVSNYVRKNFKKGDILRFAPSWGLEGLQHFKNLEVDLHEDFEEDELIKFERLWVIAHLNERNPKIPEKFKLLSKKEFNKITLYLYKIPYRGKPLYDFLENLQDAKVIRKRKAKDEKCTNWREGGWYCEFPHDWKYVGNVIRDVAGSRRNAIWAHAIENGDPLLIIYEKVPKGSSIDIFYGLTQRAIEQANGSPVFFEVIVNDTSVFKTEIMQDDKKWHKSTINLNKFKEENIKVIFKIIAKDNSWRQFCFKGSVWK